MQLYAEDQHGHRLFVGEAIKGKDYACIECGERVRMRSGPKRSSHFYHIFPAGECRQSGKSQEHLDLQSLVQREIGIASCEQEVPFPEIGRIADVAWHAQRIVFEIQCSPISKEEVEARCEDYQRIGWYVVWLLLDSTFLRKKVSDVLQFLQMRTHYWASAEEGYIYDLFSWHERGLRRDFRHPSMPKRLIVQLATLEENCDPVASVNTPTFLAKRLLSWRYFAKSDLVWCEKKTQNAEWEKIKGLCRQLEEKSENAAGPLRYVFGGVWHQIVDWAYQSRRL